MLYIRIYAGVKHVCSTVVFGLKKKKNQGTVDLACRCVVRLHFKLPVMHDVYMCTIHVAANNSLHSMCRPNCLSPLMGQP